MKALSKNPDERPQTAEQFRAELLAIEKERRAAVGRRSGPHSASSLAPVPRKVTPLDQQETKVSGPPANMPSPWSAREDTLKNVVEPQTNPGQATVPTQAPKDVARTTVEGTGALVFKVATVALVLLALLLAGAYVLQVLNQSKDHFVPGEPTEVPPNAPIPGRSSARLWEQRPSKGERRPLESVKAMLEGDEAFRRLDLDRAVSHYEAAWKLDTRPDLALKLGEVARLQRNADEAKAWWEEYRKIAADVPEPVREYFEERLGP